MESQLKVRTLVKRNNLHIAHLMVFSTVLLLLWNMFPKHSHHKKSETTQSFSSCQSWVWERQHTILNSKGKMILKWNFTHEDITMLVIAETTGYVGIGLSLNPSMNGSDIVIGWIKDGQIYLQDFHANANSHPVLDSQQDYDLLFGEENETHTILCFRRKLNTCDKNDIQITNSTLSLLWAIHPNDPQTSSNKLIYHGNHKGTSWIYLLDIRHENPPLDDLEYFEVGSNNTRSLFKYASYYYWCQYVKIPNFGHKRHFIGFMPHFQPENLHLIHHVLLYQCEGNNLDEKYGNDPDGHMCYMPAYYERDLNCRKELIIYGVGRDSTFLPPHVGYPFGSTDGKPMYFRVEIHYHYHKYMEDFRDTSRIRLYHTRHLRQFEANTMNIGAKFFEIIPPKQEDFPTTGICSSSCLEKFIPPTGIHVFRYFMHGHKSVTKMSFHHFRNNVEINTITNDNMQFYYQTKRYLQKEITILPNDWVAVKCIHDTRNRTLTTRSGVASEDEMCIIMLDYYPPIDLSICYSALDPWEIHKATGNYYMSMKDTVSIAQIPFISLLYNTALGLYLSYRNITTEQANTLRNLYLKGNHFSQCLNGTTPLDYYTNDRVRFSDGKHSTIKNSCIA